MNTIEAKGNILSMILKAIKSAISSVPSCISGFDVTESEATIDGEVYKSSRFFKSGNGLVDTNGNPINLKIDLAALNVNENETIKKCLEGISRIEVAHKKDRNNEFQVEAYKILLGVTPNEDSDLSWIKSSEAEVGGLLYPIDPKATELSPQWQELMNSFLYALRCEAQGYPEGNISGVNLTKIRDLVSTYLIKCGAESAEGTSGARGIQVVSLVMPIVLLIQNYLSTALDNALDTLDTNKSTEQPEENTQEQTPEEPQAEETPAEEAPTEPALEDNGGQPVQTSKKLNIKLQKITGSTDIDLLGLSTNFNPGESLTVVDDVLQNPDFLQLITETPQTYEVCVDDEGYDVNPCTDLIVEPNENLTQLFIQANQFSRNLHMIHWLSIGNDMEKLHIKAEELYGELDEEIDLLAELIVEKTGTIIDINTIETWNTVGTQNRTFQQGIECIKQDAQSFIDYIDITYPNQPSDVQSILDDWLRYWNKQINYFIVREQE